MIAVGSTLAQLTVGPSNFRIYEELTPGAGSVGMSRYATGRELLFSAVEGPSQVPRETGGPILRILFGPPLEA
jgi:hypothetical protein